ncbi:phosphoribosyltransferase-like protein [Glutamicibacter arilaitensis]|uniref:phosphoribosyltransferase-like protein n=1 Tax=Glutamicibacter arilaitensis TaxID=256701 RepID=UPI003FD534A0
MKLSDTEAGAQWLLNFRSEDRQMARKILGAFVLDSWTSARASLLDLVRREISRVKKEGPVWAIPVMDSGDIRRAMKLKDDIPLIAFENFEPGMDIPSTPGSEGLIGHLLRDVQGKGVLQPTDSLSTLRTRRVRTILVVTDTIETGNQVAKFVQALLANRTLKSWKSFGWIKIRVVSYAVSKVGVERLSLVNAVDAVNFVRSAPTIYSLPWPAADINQAIDVCTRNGQGRDLLGYGEQASLFGFQDRVPNTIPRIFRQSGEDWSPLFEGKGGRLVPTDMISELLKSTPTDIAHNEVVAAVRQERLSTSINKQLRESNRDILVALSLLRVSSNAVHLVEVALGQSHSEVLKLLDYLVSQGWVTATYQLTHAGISELAASKRKPRRVKTDVSPPSFEYYYPESLG